MEDVYEKNILFVTLWNCDRTVLGSSAVPYCCHNIKAKPSPSNIIIKTEWLHKNISLQWLNHLHRYHCCELSFKCCMFIDLHAHTHALLIITVKMHVHCTCNKDVHNFFRLHNYDINNEEYNLKFGFLRAIIKNQLLV